MKKIIKSANACYTGGGIYLYYGEFEDGKFFMTADDWNTDYHNVLILNEYPEINIATYSEWQENHTIDRIEENEALRIFVDILKWISREVPDGNYQLLDINARLNKQLKELKKIDGNEVNLGTFTVDVIMTSENLYDVYIAHEGSSGENYLDVSADKIGHILAGDIECIAENYKGEVYK